jgi:hypothetical protein
MWIAICDYLNAFFPSNVTNIVDIAGGGCEFINNIVHNDQIQKSVIDLNPDVVKNADSDVNAINDSIDNLDKYFEKQSVSIFFMSNFLEHISKDDINDLLHKEYELLHEKGEVWILTPNIKYVGGKYWDFFDHITPITEKSLIEAAEMSGFKTRKCITRFLPFTTKSRLPQSGWIVRLYLKLMPISGRFFGEQSFLIFSK